MSLPGRKKADPLEAFEPSSDYAAMRENSGLRKSSRRSLEVDDDDEEIYIVKQNTGYCAIFFSVVQTIILIVMMWQCQVAPLSLNPMIGPYPDALSEWGGKNSILILEDGETWRLLTPIFLHAGLLHLAGNVAVQMDTGVFFEKEWGSARWMIIYIVSALGSSILSVIVMPNAVSVGSSGAVMGLFGGKLAEVIVRACERQHTDQEKLGAQIRKEQCGAVTCSVIVVMAFSFIPFVDWAAHLGGVVAGFFAGLVIFSLQSAWVMGKIIWLLVGLTTTVVGFAVAINYMYSGEIDAPEELRDVCGYYTESFEDYQCNCMREEYFANGGQE